MPSHVKGKFQPEKELERYVAKAGVRHCHVLFPVLPFPFCFLFGRDVFSSKSAKDKMIESHQSAVCSLLETKAFSKPSF